MENKKNCRILQWMNNLTERQSKKMKEVYIWGAGYYSEFIYSIIDKKHCVVKGFIDNDGKKQGKTWGNSLLIYKPEILETEKYDHIFISPMDYKEIERICLDMGIEKEKLVVYWKDEESIGLFKNRGLMLIEALRYKLRLDNAPYEFGVRDVPIIKSGEELLKKIIRKRSSLCRFGDGEFEIMMGRERPWFQKVRKELSKRLCEIIKSDEDGIIIALAADFGNLDMFKDESADIIREYMANGTRDDIMKYIDLKKVYYDAYVTRPYILYKERTTADKLFPLFKQIWRNRNIIVVEGKYARIGVGNDLLVGAKTIKRILCPSKNAWDVYDKILSSILKLADREDLICISLGPTATVMAYDLAKKGYQVLDIGQLDNEYEWYLQGMRERASIPGKMVAEIERHYIEELLNEEYAAQICMKIDGIEDV